MWPTRCGYDQLHARMHNALAAGNLPSTECLGYRCIRYASGADMEQSTSANGPKRMHLACIEVRIIGITSTPIGPPWPGDAYQASWHGKRDCDAGIPTQAQDHPGPVCRGRQPQRAKARDSLRRRDGSSLFYSLGGSMNLPQIVGQTITLVTANCYQKLCLIQPQSELRRQPSVVD